MTNSGAIQALFRRCSGAIPALFWRYSGAIQALFRRYSGTTRALFRRYSGCITCGVADENDRGKRVREHALQVVEELAFLPEVERNVVNEHPVVCV